MPRVGRGFQLTQRFQDVIKGTIQVGVNLSISMNDFTYLPANTSLLPLHARITFTCLNAPTFAYVAQWDGENQNAYINTTEFMLSSASRVTRNFYWPLETALMLSSKGTQALLDVAHCDPGSSAYGKYPPLIYYFCELTVACAPAVMTLAPDTPHSNIKHGRKHDDDDDGTDDEIGFEMI